MHTNLPGQTLQGPQFDSLGDEPHLSSNELHSGGFRFSNLSAYGTQHPADIALGHAQLARRLHGSAAGGHSSTNQNLHFGQAIMDVGDLNGN